jgi:hypothetical protein
MKYQSSQIIDPSRGAIGLADEALFNIRMTLGDGNNVEIGVMYGHTTIPMASALVNVAPTFKHYAIDPWDGASVYGFASVSRNWIPKNNANYRDLLVDENFNVNNVPESERQYFSGDIKSRMGSSYNNFEANLKSFDSGSLIPYVVPVIQFSHLVDDSEIAKMGPVAMLFIDGDHTMQAVCRDILKYYALVKIGGVIIFDDWDGFGVTQGYKMAVGQMKGNWTPPTFPAHGKCLIKRLS